jgi:hypothetical protein
VGSGARHRFPAPERRSLARPHLRRVRYRSLSVRSQGRLHAAAELSVHHPSGRGRDESTRRQPAGQGSQGRCRVRSKNRLKALMAPASVHVALGLPTSGRRVEGGDNRSLDQPDEQQQSYQMEPPRFLPGCRHGGSRRQPPVAASAARLGNPSRDPIPADCHIDD